MTAAVLIISGMGLAPAPALGAGYEVGSVGAVALGRGGAFTARADDLTALSVNPAGLAGLAGTRVLGSLELPWARLKFTRAGTDADGQPFRPVSNQGGAGYVPFGAVSSDFGGKGFTAALGAFGPSAYGRSRFDPSGPQRFQFVSMDLMLALYGAAIGWRPTPALDLGVSVQLGHVLRARMSQGLNAWFGTAQGPNPGYDMRATLDFRNAFGLGILLGALYRPPVQGLQIGLAVRPFPVHFELEGTLTPAYPGAYLARLASAGRVYLTSARARSSLDLPAEARLGIRWAWGAGKHEGDIEADVAWERWSVVDRMDVSLGGALAIRQDLGADDVHPLHAVTVPRSWRDTAAVRLGSDVSAIPGWLTVRAGAFWESAAVPEATTRLDFPSFQRVGLSAGFTVTVRPVDLSVGYAHVFQPGRTVSPGTSASVVQMPLSPCQPPYQGTACATQGVPPGYEVGAGRYESGFDLLTIAVGATFGP